MWQRWTKEEIEILKSDNKADIPIIETAERLDRPVNSVRTKLTALKLNKKTWKKWSKEETEQLRTEILTRIPWDEIAKRHKRTIRSVKAEAKLMGSSMKKYVERESEMKIILKLTHYIDANGDEYKYGNNTTMEIVIKDGESIVDGFGYSCEWFGDDIIYSGKSGYRMTTASRKELEKYNRR